MLELQKTYGKTIHTWAIDVTPDLPLGPPDLMMSYTDDGQLSPQIIRERDEKFGISTEEKRKYRASYLPPYEKAPGVDEWEKTGKGLELRAHETRLVK
jgi:hypothetical protein